MAFEKAYTFLSDRGYADRVKTFPVSSATVELAAAALGTEPARIAKSLTFLDDRIRTEEDIERYLGLSVLGDIPNADDKKSHQYGYYKAYGAHGQKKTKKKRRAK